MAQPFEGEFDEGGLDYDSFSVRVKEADIALLPDMLQDLVYSGAVERMQVSPYSCIPEPGYRLGYCKGVVDPR